tara:strand:- start:433 stop:600 length:168 start_codon:yes stop_codon:yes gene_type:complete
MVRQMHFLTKQVSGATKTAMATVTMQQVSKEIDAVKQEPAFGLQFTTPLVKKLKI